MQVVTMNDLTESQKCLVIDLTDVFETITDELWLSFVENLNHINQMYLEEYKINQNSVIVIQTKPFEHRLHVFRNDGGIIVLRSFSIEHFENVSKPMVFNKRLTWLTSEYCNRSAFFNDIIDTW